MGLKDRITDDMKSAMRARQAERLGAIRLLLAAIKQKEVDERVVADDAAVVSIVERLIKQRKDSIEQFGKAGRTDLVEKETAELALLQEYLPQALSPGEISAAVDAAIAEVRAGGATLAPGAMGKVMGLLKARLAGRADMSEVAALVKARISG
ncbi:MAG TPA: GatB/YqeY domain-containing protein [Burkholderiaceae bacterium]|nr:GatB/YqeY domain-containing protein [Burkholderiaceae bacterium]